MKRLLLFFLILSLASLAIADLKIAHPEQHHVESLVGHVENQVVLKFDRSVYRNFRPLKLLRGQFGNAELDALAEKYGAVRIIQRFPTAPIKYYRGREIDLKAWFNIQFSGPVELDAVVADFISAVGVIEAQKIGIHAVSKVPNDGNYTEQWHLNQSNDHDIDAPEAWDIETGDEDVIVAILDTGVRYFHKDLGGGNASFNNPTDVDGNIWINSAEKNGDSGVDDDGNGFIDDWVGWDFVDDVSNGWPGEDASTPDNDPRDFNGHGTHCSGIVASINNNGYATAAPGGGWGNGSLTSDGNGVKIMPMRIGYSGRLFIFELGYVQMDFAASAFYYAADNGADIASCSWGSSNSGGLGDAIDYFLASGGLIFKAAGNDDNESSDYMTDRSDIIAVASTDQNDVKSDFSTYGTWVDISAPGTDIYSTYHDHSDEQNDYVASLSGTSMATPLTAGVAAIVWSQNPGWSAAQVEQQLYNTADDISGISGNSSYQGKLGAGRINAFNALGGGSGPLPPNADFAASPTSGCAPLAINFTDQSTGDVDSWTWDFGDGGSSTAENPSHSYNGVGTFTVMLTVTGPGGSDSATKTEYITVSTTPTAAFIGSPLNGDAPLAVSFTDQSTGVPTSWSWDFGDGGSSTSQNPSHTFNAAGTFTVTLTASNTCGNDVETKVDYITVTEPPCNAPVAAFTGAPLNGTLPLNVSFTDQSINTPTSWNWNFGDGSSSTLQNPSHTFNAAGSYTVKLTATNSCGSDGETKIEYITVTEPSQNDELHVGAIEATKETFWRWSRATARVRVFDQNDTHIANATVTGNWSGSASGSASFDTGSDGWGQTSTNYTRNATDFTFCVTTISKPGYTYNPSTNVATCAGTDGSTSTIMTSITPEEMKQIEKDTGEKMAFASPNPFNPSTNITFLLPEAADVKLEIYNVLGKRVSTLYNQPLQGGVHTARWNAQDDFGADVGSGHYFYVLSIGDQENTMTMKGKLLYMK
jgi:PKD repeat protein